MHRLLLFAALILISGCSAAGPEGRFNVSADAPNMLLENQTSGTIYYVVIEASSVPLIDLAPVEAWPTLSEGEMRSVPYESLEGYQEGDTRAVVFWSRGGGPKRKDVQL